MANDLYEVWWKRKGDRFANSSTQVYASSANEAIRMVLSGHRDIEIDKVKKL